MIPGLTQLAAALDKLKAPSCADCLRERKRLVDARRRDGGDVAGALGMVIHPAATLRDGTLLCERHA